MRWLRDKLRTWLCKQWEFEQAVVRLLRSGDDWWGCELREELRQFGLRFDAVGFYRRMARMEDHGKVLCRRSDEGIAGFRFRRNIYRLPPCGD